MSNASAPPAVVITPAGFLEHWQGHRRLTRGMIQAFPGDQLFSFSVGSLRPFGELAMEMISTGAPWSGASLRANGTGSQQREARAAGGMLRLWDDSTTGSDVARTSHDADVAGLAFGPDNGSLITVDKVERKIRVWLFDSDAAYAEIREDAAIARIRFSQAARCSTHRPAGGSVPGSCLGRVRIQCLAGQSIRPPSPDSSSRSKSTLP